MTALELKEPGILFRGVILLAQGKLYKNNYFSINFQDLLRLRHFNAGEMCNLLFSSNFSTMLMFFFILPLPPPPPQAFLRLSSMEHSESPEKWRQARGPRNTLISLIINSNIRPNVIVSNCMG